MSKKNKESYRSTMTNSYNPNRELSVLDKLETRKLIVNTMTAILSIIAAACALSPFVIYGKLMVLNDMLGWTLNPGAELGLYVVWFSMFFLLTYAIRYYTLIPTFKSDEEMWTIHQGSMERKRTGESYF